MSNDRKPIKNGKTYVDLLEKAVKTKNLDLLVHLINNDEVNWAVEPEWIRFKMEDYSIKAKILIN